MHVRAAILVAVEADAGLCFRDHHRILRRMQAVTTGTGLLGLFVLASMPVGAGAAVVTVKTGFVLWRRWRFLAEGDRNQACRARLLVVLGEIAVAGAAHCVGRITSDRLAGGGRGARITSDAVLGLGDGVEALMAFDAGLGRSSFRAGARLGRVRTLGGLGKGTAREHAGRQEKGKSGGN